MRPGDLVQCEPRTYRLHLFDDELASVTSEHSARCRGVVLQVRSLELHGDGPRKYCDVFVRVLVEGSVGWAYARELEVIGEAG